MVALVNVNDFSLKWHLPYLKFSLSKASALFCMCRGISLGLHFFFLWKKMWWFLFCFCFFEHRWSYILKIGACMEAPPPIRFELLTFYIRMFLGFQLTDFFQF